MKKKLFGLGIVVALMFFITACSDSDEDSAISNDLTQEELVVKFRYKGIDYTSTFEESSATLSSTDGAPSVRLHSLLASDVYRQILVLPNFAAYGHEDGTTEYFDTYDEMIEVINLAKLPKELSEISDSESMENEVGSKTIGTRASGYCYFTFYNYCHPLRGPIVDGAFWTESYKFLLPIAKITISGFAMVNDGNYQYAKMAIWTRNGNMKVYAGIRPKGGVQSIHLRGTPLG